jgi:hypothetical protein
MRSKKLIVFTGLFLAAWFVLSNVYPQLLLGLFLLIGFGIPYLFFLIYPLIAFNTIFLYFLAALPTLHLLRQTPRNWVAIAAAAGLPPLVAFGIPFYEGLAATRQAQ